MWMSERDIEMLDGSVDVFNVVGSNVHSGEISNNASINVEGAGLFMIRIVSEGESITRKLIVH